MAWVQVASAETAAYVAQAGQTPVSPYDTWAKAASNIQDAISVVAAGTVWVSNGVYGTGGVTNWTAGTGSFLTNRVAITNAITVRSANNDPANTIIQGAWDPVTTNGPAAVRCVYMVNGASLIGFTLTNGATLGSGGGGSDTCGGGVYCDSVGATLSNCVIVGNSVYASGGGAYRGTLRNCVIADNIASVTAGSGAGASDGILYGCTVARNRSGSNCGGLAGVSMASNCMFVGNSSPVYGGGACGGNYYGCTFISNSANYGGGLFGSASIAIDCLFVGNSAWTGGGGVYAADALYNCTVVSNTAPTGGGVYNFYGTTVYYNCIIYLNSSNWAGGAVLANSCTIPAQSGWCNGNITNDPLFVDANAGNYRLRTNSPCVNAGTNGIWTTTYPHDLDGSARIREDIVDMGAYEFVRKAQGMTVEM